MSPNHTPETALSEIEKIHAVLSTARRWTNEGRTIDLSAVDARIRTLCTAVEGLPQTQSRALAPALTALLTEFDALGKELSERFASMPSLNDLASAKDAAMIYGAATKHFP
ncbi:MAG: hypothetical protein JNM81_16485 [Rhodospirillaceae bacterium]|nr:hypothetical protein [Rhodospirillaceae bacterium]